MRNSQVGLLSPRVEYSDHPCYFHKINVLAIIIISRILKNPADGKNHRSVFSTLIMVFYHFGPLQAEIFVILHSKMMIFFKKINRKPIQNRQNFPGPRPAQMSKNKGGGILIRNYRAEGAFTMDQAGM